MWKWEEEDRRRRPKVGDPRTLPPCMGGYVGRPIKPMPGTAEYKKMEQEIALAKEEAARYLTVLNDWTNMEFTYPSK